MTIGRKNQKNFNTNKIRVCLETHSKTMVKQNNGGQKHNLKEVASVYHDYGFTVFFERVYKHSQRYNAYLIAQLEFTIRPLITFLIS